MTLLPASHRLATRLALLCLICLMVGAAVLIPQHAAKANATYVVDTTSDNSSLSDCSPAANDCSLRGAIAASNGVGGTNTITFDSTVFPGTITVASQLSIASNLTISGDGQVTISGNNATRIFNVQSGRTVTLDGLTITDGYVDGSGGAIANAGDLTISYSTVANSTATSNGGAVYDVGTLLVLASTINGNSADRGGGVFEAGAGTSGNLVISTFYNNSATSGGGGIYNNGTLMLSGGDFIQTSAASGGGIHSLSTVTIIDSTMTGNTSNYGAHFQRGHADGH